jgi:soluble lytic murein transglycosylase-like protein
MLDMNFLSSRVLTTYAALLLRDLLDYFDGNALLASAAYNGSKRHPSLEYASGVESVAGYARRVIGNTARLKGSIDRKPASATAEN